MKDQLAYSARTASHRPARCPLEMMNIRRILENNDTRPGKDFGMTLQVIIMIVTAAIYSPVLRADANRETGQTLELYCEGKDWASNTAKHISVSIDMVNKTISILDPLRDASRVLRLIETPTQYKARGDHAGGYIDPHQERTAIGAGHTDYCEHGELCDVYISYATEFKLNRQTGEFEYLVVEEVREQRSDNLLVTRSDWGIFREARCRRMEQRY
jgi:hypothetical protein